MTVPATYDAALVIHAAATFALVGLIWFVQIVHYPLFTRVGDEGFISYEQEHQRRTGLVVAPMMLAESLSAVWIVWLIERNHVADVADVRAAAWAGLILLFVIWVWTFGVMVPIHRRLESASCDKAELAQQTARLVRMNLPRVAAWTVRGALAAWLIAQRPG